MGGQKSEPINLTTETNQSEPTSQQTPDNRHQDVLLLSYLHSPYLCAYLRAYLCPPISVPVQVYRSVTTITEVYAPPPI